MDAPFNAYDSIIFNLGDKIYGKSTFYFGANKEGKCDMTILANIKALLEGLYCDDFRPEVLRGTLTGQDIDQQRRDVFDAIRAQFDHQTGDKEAYIYFDYTDAELAAIIIFGALSPDTIIKAAQAWNGEITSAFLADVRKVCGVGEDNILTGDNVQLGTPDTYNLAGWTQELGNLWYPYSEHAVLNEVAPGHYIYETILPEQTLKDILSNPGDYVLAEVNIKS